MARYLLMNKNTPVLEFDYDLEVHAVMKILEVHDARYAPPSTVDQKGNVTKKALNAWWKGRAIPASRNQIQQVLDCLDLDSTLDCLCQIAIGSMIQQHHSSGKISIFLIIILQMILEY